MNGVLATAVLLPFLLALLPAIPSADRLAPRRMVLLALIAAGLTLLVTLGSEMPHAGAIHSATGFFRDDPLARTTVLLPPLALLLTTLRTAEPGEAGRVAAARVQRWPVAAQLATATAMLCCRTDLLALLPIGIGVLVLLSPRVSGEPAGDRSFQLAALPVMAVGVALLTPATGLTVHWGDLGSVPASTRSLGLVLLIAPVLLLSAEAFVRPVLLLRSAPARGLLPLLLLVCAVDFALRARAAAPLAPALMLAGGAPILLVLLLLPGCRALQQRVFVLGAVEAGAALVAVSVGSATAALMLVGFLTLLLPAALLLPASAASHRTRALAVASLAGLPPFGPFAAGLLLFQRLWSVDPRAAVLLLGAGGLAALFALDALRRDTDTTPPAPVSAAVIAFVLVLVLTFWLGLAMPTPLSDWLAQFAEAHP